jgi:hypothetical protein
MMWCPCLFAERHAQQSKAILVPMGWAWARHPFWVICGLHLLLVSACCAKMQESSVEKEQQRHRLPLDVELVDTAGWLPAGRVHK